MKNAIGQVLMFWLVALLAVLILLGLDRVAGEVRQLNRGMVELNQKVKVMTLNIKPGSVQTYGHRGK